MALPTLPSCWSHKHEHIEKQLSRIRQQHQRFQDQWKDASNYYQRQNLKTEVGRSLISEASFKKSMDAYSTLEEKNKKAAALHKRREKLMKLIKEENCVYESELQRLSLGNYSRLKEMKEKSENLKSAREEKRKQIAEEKLYEHWKENNPELRSLESELHRDHVKEVWGEQKHEKQQAAEEEIVEDRKFANQYEEARMKAMENIRKKEERRLEEEKERAKILKQQMEDLKARDQAATALRREEEEIIQEQWKLEQLQEKRKKMEEQRKQSHLQRFLHHQYKAQLRRRAQQIQEELELDRKILQSLQEEETRRAEVNTARQQKAKEDVAWMKQVLEQQLKLERKREAELDLVYREEARRMWEQREDEWRKERMAREKLMSEVLGEREQQIIDRAEENRQRQQELLQEREELLLDLEEVQKTSRREKEDVEIRKQMRQDELNEQLTERRYRSETHRREEEDENEREKQEVQFYGQMMKEETSRMKEHGFVPKRRGRTSRIAWD